MWRAGWDLVLADQRFDPVRVLQVELSESPDFLPPEAPELVVALVYGNPVEPGEERTIVVEFREREVNLGEYLLGDILYVAAVTDVVIDDIEDSLLILSDNFLECGLISFFAPPYQVAVVIGIGVFLHEDRFYLLWPAFGRLIFRSRSVAACKVSPLLQKQKRTYCAPSNGLLKKLLPGTTATPTS